MASAAPPAPRFSRTASVPGRAPVVARSGGDEALRDWGLRPLDGAFALRAVRNLLGGCLKTAPAAAALRLLGSTMISSGASEKVAHFVALRGRRSPPDSAQRIPGYKVCLDLFFAHEGLADASAHRHANLPSVPREGRTKP
jgi:hypothetical protein